MSHRYTVFFDQIDQTNFDVWAKNKEEAEEKGRRDWIEFLRENMHNSATVERNPDKLPTEDEPLPEWEADIHECPKCGHRKDEL